MRPIGKPSGGPSPGRSDNEQQTAICARQSTPRLHRIGPGMPEIPDNPMFNMKPNTLIYGARYGRMMEAFGGKGFFVEDPKDLKGALAEALVAQSAIEGILLLTADPVVARYPGLVHQV